MKRDARSAVSLEAWERALIDAACVREAGAPHSTAVLCRVRACHSSITVQRQEVPPRVHWSCPRCRSGGSLDARTTLPTTVDAATETPRSAANVRLCARLEPMAFQRFFELELRLHSGARALAAARPSRGAIELEGHAEELRALRRALGSVLRQSLERGARLEIEGLLGALALARPPRTAFESPRLPPLDAASAAALARPAAERVYTLELDWLHAEPPQRHGVEVAGDLDFAALGRLIVECYGFDGEHRSLFACGEHLIAPRGVELPCELEVAEEILFGVIAPPPGGALRFTFGFRAPRLVVVYVRAVREL